MTVTDSSAAGPVVQERSDRERTARPPQAGPPLPIPAVVAAALTVVSVVLFTSGPRPDTSAAATLDYLRAHQDRTQLVAFLVLASAMPLVVYTGAMYRRLRRLGVSAPGCAIALAGGVLASGSLLVSGMVTWAAAQAAPDLDGGTARALADLWFAAGGVGFAAPLALLLAGIAVPCLFMRLVPRVLGGIGLALAVVGAVSTGALLTSALYPLLPVTRFGGLLWLIAIGAALPMTRHRAA